MKIMLLILYKMSSCVVALLKYIYASKQLSSQPYPIWHPVLSTTKCNLYFINYQAIIFSDSPHTPSSQFLIRFPLLRWCRPWFITSALGLHGNWQTNWQFFGFDSLTYTIRARVACLQHQQKCLHKNPIQPQNSKSLTHEWQNLTTNFKYATGSRAAGD